MIKAVIGRLPGGDATTVQSLLLPVGAFTPATARAWARSHGFRRTAVDTKGRYHRIRQADPGVFAAGSLRTITFGRSGGSSNPFPPIVGVIARHMVMGEAMRANPDQPLGPLTELASMIEARNPASGYPFWSVSYDYVTPGPAGPLFGRMTFDYPVERGEIIHAPFGLARVRTVRKVNAPKAEVSTPTNDVPHTPQGRLFNPLDKATLTALNNLALYGRLPADKAMFRDWLHAGWIERYGKAGRYRITAQGLKVWEYQKLHGTRLYPNPSLFGIMTEQTCAENCWYARDETCRCSCGGKNHGVLRTASGERPERTARIDSYVYGLKAVGKHSAMENEADAINAAAGDRKGSFGYTYRWRHTDPGAPARVKYATRDQANRWPELTQWRGLEDFDFRNSDISLLWVRNDVAGAPPAHAAPPMQAAPIISTRPESSWQVPRTAPKPVSAPKAKPKAKPEPERSGPQFRLFNPLRERCPTCHARVEVPHNRPFHCPSCNARVQHA